MPHGEIPERARPMLSPVMHRRRLELIQPRVVVPPIVLEGFQAGLTLRGIEVAPRQEHTSRVDAILERNVRAGVEPNPEALRRLEP